MRADISAGVLLGKKSLPEMKYKSTCAPVGANGSSCATAMSALQLAQEANPQRVLNPVCTLKTSNFLGAFPLPTCA